MKFKTNPYALATALKTAAQTAAKKSSVPAMGCTRIRAVGHNDDALLSPCTSAQKAGEIEQRAPGDAQKAADVAHGNVAAMREALNQLRDWALLDINENAIRSDEPNYKKLVDGIIEITNAAISSPARNCDRFATEREARNAWWAAEVQPRIDDKPMDHPEMSYADWLFAKAEGGAS